MFVSCIIHDNDNTHLIRCTAFLQLLLLCLGLELHLGFGLILGLRLGLELADSAHASANITKIARNSSSPGTTRFIQSKKQQYDYIHRQ